jgi:hypothetical protein
VSSPKCMQFRTAARILPHIIKDIGKIRCCQLDPEQSLSTDERYFGFMGKHVRSSIGAKFVVPTALFL